MSAVTQAANNPIAQPSNSVSKTTMSVPVATVVLGGGFDSINTECDKLVQEYPKILEEACGVKTDFTTLLSGGNQTSASETQARLDKECTKKCYEAYIKIGQDMDKTCSEPGKGQYEAVVKSSMPMSCLQHNGKFCEVDQMEKYNAKYGSVPSGSNIRRESLDKIAQGDTQFCGPCSKGQVDYSLYVMEVTKLEETSLKSNQDKFSQILSKCPTESFKGASELTFLNEKQTITSDTDLYGLSKNATNSNSQSSSTSYYGMASTFILVTATASFFLLSL